MAFWFLSSFLLLTDVTYSSRTSQYLQFYRRPSPTMLRALLLPFYSTICLAAHPHWHSQETSIPVLADYDPIPHIYKELEYVNFLVLEPSLQADGNGAIVGINGSAITVNTVETKVASFRPMSASIAIIVILETGEMSPATGTVQVQATRVDGSGYKNTQTCDYTVHDKSSQGFATCKFPDDWNDVETLNFEVIQSGLSHSQDQLGPMRTSQNLGAPFNANVSADGAVGFKMDNFVYVENCSTPVQKDETSGRCGCKGHGSAY